MSDSHHSFFGSSSIGGMSRLDENTHKNTISNRSDVAILEDGEIKMSQDGIEIVSDEEAMMNQPMKASFDLCIKILIISRRVELLYFVYKLAKIKVINSLNSVKT